MPVGNVSLLHDDQHADGDPLRVALAAAIKDAGKIWHAAQRHKAGVEKTFDAVVAGQRLRWKRRWLA
jgi:hypothetical protein